METGSYSIILNSADKISGTNNNAVFQVNWDDVLPRSINKFKVIFTFQTLAGKYEDGLYAKLNQNPYNSNSLVLDASAGSSTLTFFGPLDVDMYKSLYIYALEYDAIPMGTFITSNGLSNVYLSQPLKQAAGTVVRFNSYWFFQRSQLTQINFSSARVNVNFNSRSYSYDTSTKAPSTTLGVIQRDVQLSTTKSNTFSSFYAQNPPRVIDRPTNNLLNVTIYNSYPYNGTNNNLLFDNWVLGGVNLRHVGFSDDPAYMLDMTSWTMVLEFIPIIE